MKETPLLFKSEMVRALLEGRKTQTRRLVKNRKHPDFGCDIAPGELAREQQHVIERSCPYGQPRDRLWVKEAWHVGLCADSFKPCELDTGTWLYDNGGLWYPATNTVPPAPISPKGRYRHSRFMPRWASRTLLEITAVRVERLQDISEEDSRAEGCVAIEGCMWHTFKEADAGIPMHAHTTRDAYEALWESINGAGSWDVNPYVWVLEFRRIEP